MWQIPPRDKLLQIQRVREKLKKRSLHKWIIYWKEIRLFDHFIYTLYEKRFSERRKIHITICAGILISRRGGPLTVQGWTGKAPKGIPTCIIVTYSQQGHRKLCVFPTLYAVTFNFSSASQTAFMRSDACNPVFRTKYPNLEWLIPLFIFIYTAKDTYVRLYMHYILSNFLILFLRVFP